MTTQKGKALVLAALALALAPAKAQSPEKPTQKDFNLEMAFAGGIGATLTLASLPMEGAVERDDVRLFSESTSRFLVEVAKEQQHAFEQALAGVPHAVIGETVAEPSLTIRGRNGNPVVQATLDDLKRSWQQPLEPYF